MIERMIRGNWAAFMKVDAADTRLRAALHAAIISPHIFLSLL